MRIGHGVRHGAWCLAMLLGSWTAPVCAAPPSALERVDIFPPEPKHNHASCVVQTADGSLLAAWYSGSGERKSDDVLIQGAWLAPGGRKWGPRFLMADTPDYPDCNPALFAAPDGSLWLFWPTVLDHRWEGALLKYARCARPRPGQGAPQWTSSGVLHVTPRDFKSAMDRAIGALGDDDKTRYRKLLDETRQRAGDLLYQRLGWMPRVHPLALPSGRWILPLYCDTFSASIVLLTDDRGTSWTTSEPLIGFGNIQPSLVREDGGAVVAFMRDNGPRRRILLSRSTDEGATWSPVTASAFPNPGAGVDALRLKSGRWALVYNDLERGRHSLAVSVSDDEGKTWKWTRHLEQFPVDAGAFHYPSMIQAADGTVHVTYTRRLKGQGSTIAHARFAEDWLLAPDGRAPK